MRQTDTTNARQGRAEIQISQPVGNLFGKFWEGSGKKKKKKKKKKNLVCGRRQVQRSFRKVAH